MLVRAHRSAAVLLCIGSLVVTLAQRSGSAATSVAPTVPGRVLVRFNPDVSDAQRASLHRRLGAVVVRRIPELRTDVVQVPVRAFDSAIRAYAKTRGVSLAEPDYVAHVQLHPNDPCFSTTCTPGAYGYQWDTKWLNAEFGWDAFPGKTHTATERLSIMAADPLRLPKIAVLDTLIDASHEDWIPQGGSSTDVRNGGMLDLADAKDYVSGQHSGSASYHGTFVAGIAAAAAGNNIGAAGIGYMSQVMPVAVVDGSGNADADLLAQAILYAWQRGARVINLSLGLVADSATVHDAIKMATGKTAPGPGVKPPSTGPALVVAAAGNNTGDAPFYPGSYPEVMSVSGTDPTDRRASCSNYNSNVSVSAPADGIVSLREHGGVMKGLCGTSAAAPHVSGIAAMLFAQYPPRTAAQVRSIIEKTADDRGAPGRDDYFGNGRVNLERALRVDLPTTTTGVLASIPPATGGTSTITAIASSTRAITKAEYFVDDPGCTSGQGVAMSVTNAGSGIYRVSGAMSVTPNLSTGPHSLYVRAWDGVAGSAAAVAPLYVDRVAPTITGAQTNRAAIRALQQPVTIDFLIGDDFSTVFAGGLEVTPVAGTAIRPVYTEVRQGLSLGPYRWTWLPAPEIPAGVYRVAVAVSDEARNVRKVILQDNVVVV